MDGLIVRETGNEDIEALANLMTELGYPTSTQEMGRRFAEISADPSYGALVAEQEGKVLGMVGLHGALYTMSEGAYPHGHGGKMRVMQHEEAILSRRRFLALCVAGIAGLSLASLAGCSSNRGGGGKKHGGDKKKENKDDGGGGGY